VGCFLAFDLAEVGNQAHHTHKAGQEFKPVQAECGIWRVNGDIFKKTVKGLAQAGCGPHGIGKVLGSKSLFHGGFNRL
jgi:hypothetical protein